MWNKTEFKISQHFACALEYGDYGDMTEEEIDQFDEWQYNEQDGKTGYWSIDEISENYGRCEVTAPQFHNGKVYGWTCIKKVKPAAKQTKTKWLLLDNAKITTMSRSPYWLLWARLKT